MLLFDMQVLLQNNKRTCKTRAFIGIWEKIIYINLKRYNMKSLHSHYKHMFYACQGFHICLSP